MEKTLKTLQEIIKEGEEGSLKEALSSIVEHLQKQEDVGVVAIIGYFKKTFEAQQETQRLLEAILEKKEEYPEQKFPKIQEVNMQKPDWYQEYDWDTMYEKWTKSLVSALRPIFISMKEVIASEGAKTREILVELLNKEDEEYTEVETPKTVSTGAVRSRRTTRWVVASTAKGNITGAKDGVNKDFYLPNEPIPNSEMVRLDQGSPLSNGVDYTLTGNKISYVLAPLASPNGQQEIRYQTR